ncbi:hypothetical protein AB0I72_08820, partial [Nocardiopsis sp. NPDC049922]
MPELHEIMNIFADAEEGGSHPEMPPVSSILDPLWVDKGRYHFHEDDHFIKGFDFKDVDRWWSYLDGGWDYAGYKMQDQLWTGDDSPEAKFLKALSDLTNVASQAHGAMASTTYNQTTIWDIATVVAALDDFLVDYVGSENAGLFQAYKQIDVPDGAIRGSAAGVFAGVIYDLAKRLTDLSLQLDRFHKAVNDIRGALLPKLSALVDAVDSARASPNSTIKGTLDNWYFNLSAGSEQFDEGRGQFNILYHADPPVRGIVGDSRTDINVNSELKMRWRSAYEPVFTAAGDLYTTMKSHYQTINTRLLPIRDPVGGRPPGSEPPPGGPGADGPGDDLNDVPDWLKELLKGPDDTGGGDDGPDGDGPDDELNDVPDWLKELLKGPDDTGGGDDGPPQRLDTNFPGDDAGDPGDNGLLNDPPLDTTFATTSTNDLSGNTSGETVNDPPLDTNFSTDTPGSNYPVPPPIPGAPGGGSTNDRPRQSPPLNTNFPTTDLEFDPQTGLPIDPETGQPFPVDPETGAPF